MSSLKTMTLEAGEQIWAGDFLRQPRRRVVRLGRVKSTKRFVGIALNGAVKGDPVEVIVSGYVDGLISAGPARMTIAPHGLHRLMMQIMVGGDA